MKRNLREKLKVFGVGILLFMIIGLGHMSMTSGARILELEKESIFWQKEASKYMRNYARCLYYVRNYCESPK